MLNATHFTLPWSDAVMPMPSAVDAIVDVMSRRCRVDRIRPWSVRLSVELTHQPSTWRIIDWPTATQPTPIGIPITCTTTSALLRRFYHSTFAELEHSSHHHQHKRRSHQMMRSLSCLSTTIALFLAAGNGDAFQPIVTSTNPRCHNSRRMDVFSTRLYMAKRSLATKSASRTTKNLSLIHI